MTLRWYTTHKYVTLGVQLRQWPPLNRPNRVISRASFVDADTAGSNEVNLWGFFSFGDEVQHMVWKI